MECEVCIDQLVITPVIIIITITDHRKVHPWIILAETIGEVWVAQIQIPIKGFIKWVELIKVDWAVVQIIKANQVTYTQVIIITLIILIIVIVLITIIIIIMVHLCHKVEITVFIQAQIPAATITWILTIILSTVMLIE